jgi:hypothetical protein
MTSSIVRTLHRFFLRRADNGGGDVFCIIAHVGEMRREYKLFVYSFAFRDHHRQPKLYIEP